MYVRIGHSDNLCHAQAESKQVAILRHSRNPKNCAAKLELFSPICRLQEWAGGYDGYWDIDASSGHEPGVSEAIRQMLNSGNESAS